VDVDVLGMLAPHTLEAIGIGLLDAGQWQILPQNTQ